MNTHTEKSASRPKKKGCSEFISTALLGFMGKIFRNIGNLIRIVVQLTQRTSGFLLKSARAFKAYLMQAWESDCSTFEQRTLACGAKWLRYNNGDWQLIESNGAEVETAVRELFDDLGLPMRVLLADSIEEISPVARYTSMVELGLGLPIEYIKYAYGTECTESQVESSQRTEETGTDAVSGNSREDGIDSDDFFGTLEPSSESSGRLRHGVSVYSPNARAERPTGGDET